MIRVTEKVRKKLGVVSERGYIQPITHNEYYKITTVWILIIPIYTYKKLIHFSPSFTG